MSELNYRQISPSLLNLYSEIPMRVCVRDIYSLKQIGCGMEGVRYTFTREKVAPYTLDFMQGKLHIDWAERFDISNWAFLMAFDGDIPVGAAAVAARTDALHMLEGRDDISVLWDMRVAPDHQRRGIGAELFKMAADWSAASGFSSMKIECQNTNAPACDFYQRQGAKLRVINPHGYADSDEAMLLWYFDLLPGARQ